MCCGWPGGGVGNFFDLNAIGAGGGQRIFRPELVNIVGDIMNIADTAYFVYIGRLLNPVTPQFIALRNAVAGTGAQTAEVGFFSTPAPPNKSAQSLTKIISIASIDTLTTTGIKRNTAAFATLIPAGTYLWAGLRVNMATTQPSFFSVGRDQGQGFILSQAAAALFSTAGPWAGSIIADAQAQAPHLSGELD
jgi:hypothetical protein